MNPAFSEDSSANDGNGDPNRPGEGYGPGGRSSGSALIVGFLVFCAALVSALLAWIYVAEKPENLMRRGTSRLPVVGEVPAFELVNEAGAKVAREDMLGGVWIADFIFTACGGTCPIMSQNLKNIQDRFEADPALAGTVKLVSVSVDAERDTPEKMNDYAKAYGARRGEWIFLTGSRQATQDLAIKGFKLAVLEGDKDGSEPIIHSQNFSLVDQRGRIRGYYDGTNASEVGKLLEDARKLVKEKE